MAPVRTPDGFVLVAPRSRETAQALMDAVKAVGGDRLMDVRTVTGGYHVAEAVAEEYQKNFPASEGLDEADETESTENESSETEEVEELPVTEKSTHDEINDYADWRAASSRCTTSSRTSPHWLRASAPRPQAGGASRPSWQHWTK